MEDFIDFLNQHINKEIVDGYVDNMVRNNILERDLSEAKNILDSYVDKNTKSKFYINCVGLESKEIEKEISLLSINKEKLKEKKYNLEIKLNSLRGKILFNEYVEKDLNIERDVWVDSRNNLMWAKSCIGQVITSNRKLLSAPKLLWNQADESCRSLKLAGYTNWRLPTLTELQTLLRIDTNGYNTPENALNLPEQNDLGSFWTSTDDSEDLNYAYMTSFVLKRSYSFLKNESIYARAVRNI